MYGSKETGFVPDDTTKLAEVDESELSLTGVAEDCRFFRVAAIDEAGQASAPSGQIGVAETLTCGGTSGRVGEIRRHRERPQAGSLRHASLRRQPETADRRGR